MHLGAIVSAVRPLIQATLAWKARHAALDLHVSAAKSVVLIARVQSGELDAAVAVREPGVDDPRQFRIHDVRRPSERGTRCAPGPGGNGRLVLDGIDQQVINRA